MEKNRKTGRRLHLFPLILGVYGMFLGFGLITIGLSEIKEGIGIIRFLVGLGMAGFGLFGIWDGVRDLVRPEKRAETQPVRQFILTDVSGIKSSRVTPELLRAQIAALAKNEAYRSFGLQILPSLAVGEYGMLKQILCVYQAQDAVILVAVFEESSEDGYHQMYRKRMDPDAAKKWLEQLLTGSPDFAGWGNVETKVQDEKDIEREEEDTRCEEEDSGAEESDRGRDAKAFFMGQLQDERKGRQITFWHQLLIIFGESWRNELKFFSVRDVELAVEGICEGKYRNVVLEWGIQEVDLFQGAQNDIMVIWRTNSAGKEKPRFFAKEGTITQVKFWMVHYLDSGSFEMDGWTDVTARIEKGKRKGEKKYGKLFPLFFRFLLQLGVSSL